MRKLIAVIGTTLVLGACGSDAPASQSAAPASSTTTTEVACLEYDLIETRLNTALSEQDDALDAVQSLDLAGAADEFQQMADSINEALPLLAVDPELEAAWFEAAHQTEEVAISAGEVSGTFDVGAIEATTEQVKQLKVKLEAAIDLLNGTSLPEC